MPELVDTRILAEYLMGALRGQTIEVVKSKTHGTTKVWSPVKEISHKGKLITITTTSKARFILHLRLVGRLSILKYEPRSDKTVIEEDKKSTDEKEEKEEKKSEQTGERIARGEGKEEGKEEASGELPTPVDEEEDGEERKKDPLFESIFIRKQMRFLVLRDNMKEAELRVEKNDAEYGSDELWNETMEPVWGPNSISREVFISRWNAATASGKMGISALLGRQKTAERAIVSGLGTWHLKMIFSRLGIPAKMRASLIAHNEAALGLLHRITGELLDEYYRMLRHDTTDITDIEEIYPKQVKLTRKSFEARMAKSPTKLTEEEEQTLIKLHRLAHDQSESTGIPLKSVFKKPLPKQSKKKPTRMQLVDDGKRVLPRFLTPDKDKASSSSSSSPSSHKRTQDSVTTTSILSQQAVVPDPNKPKRHKSQILKFV